MRAALGFFLLSAPVLLACSGIMEVVTGKYDLHGPPGADFAAGQGYSQTTTGEFKDGAVTMKVMGQSIQGKMSMRLRESWTLEGLSPTSARVSFREKVTEQKMQMGTERDESTEEAPLHGKVVVLERQGAGRFVARLEQGEASAELQKELDSFAREWGNLDQKYPTERVAVGATWNVPAELVAYELVSRDVLSVTGTAAYTFDEKVVWNGENCARISYRLNDIQVESWDQELSLPMKMRIGGQGTVLRSLKRHVDVQDSFEGTIELLTEGHIEGTPAGAVTEMKINAGLVSTTTR